MSQSTVLKEEDRIKVLFYDCIRSDDVDIESGQRCPIKPYDMVKDPHVVDPAWGKKLSTDNLAEEMQHQRENLESLFAHCSEDGNNLQEYLERALCNKIQKKIKENRESILRMYKENLPKVISPHLSGLLYKRIKMNHYQNLHEKHLHPSFEYRGGAGRARKNKDHPFYGLTAKINGDKSRYEEYLTFLLLDPIHDYKSTYKTVPRNYLVSQYSQTADVAIKNESGENLKGTYNAYLYKIIVNGIIDPINHNSMTLMKDLTKYKIPFDESRYPELAKVAHMSLFASYLSVLSEQSLVDFQIYKTNALDDILLHSENNEIFFYNMKKNVIIYDHVNKFWYYQMDGKNCYYSDDFFDMFDDLLDLMTNSS